MARGTNHEKFVEYQEFIATHPIYRGMPDLRNEDGSVQWEAPSNRLSGKHAGTHVARLNWWRAKAASIGISTSEQQWISKTAKTIHPTKNKPCKVCGHRMDIRYVYPTKNTLKRMAKHPELEEVGADRFATVFDLATVVYELVPKPSLVLARILKCKGFDEILETENVDEFLTWLADVYVPGEPSAFSPGAMSNAPDRLDGFHSFNLCCRSTSDKGRSSANLASYATDRRAFENWSEGNWVTANMLMGEIRKNQEIQQFGCANASAEDPHLAVITADHIGPISLGFAHRPTFRLLCTSCNSGKNNRMTLQDVNDLIDADKHGIKVCSWYNKDLWSKYSPHVQTDNQAISFNKLLRDNRSIAFDLLGKLADRNLNFALVTLLRPDYASEKWTLDSYHVDGWVIRGSFSSSPSTVKYRATQQQRNIRVSFEAIQEYIAKENRSSATKVGFLRIPDASKVLKAAAQLNACSYVAEEILEALLGQVDVSDAQMVKLVDEITRARGMQEFAHFKYSLRTFMGAVADELISNSSNERYLRPELDPE